MNRLRSAQRLAALVAGTTAMTASAHVGADAAAHHGLWTGFVHPFTGIDHLIAALGIGLAAAATLPAHGRGTGRSVAIAFLLALAAGAGLTGVGLPLPAVEPMVSVSVLAFGLLIAVARPLASGQLATIGAAFAVFHGAAHAGELGGAAALAGMLLGTVALVAVGLRAGKLLRERAPNGLRAAGVTASVIGVTLLAGLARG